MAKKKPDNNYEKILSTLQALKEVHPNYTMGQHIATALSEYGDIWGLTDREFLYALMNYKAELEWLGEEVKDEDITTIIKGGEDLDTLFDQEEIED